MIGPLVLVFPHCVEKKSPFFYNIGLFPRLHCKNSFKKQVVFSRSFQNIWFCILPFYYENAQYFYSKNMWYVLVLYYVIVMYCIMHARCHDEKVGKRMKYYMYVGKVLLAQYIHIFDRQKSLPLPSLPSLAFPCTYLENVQGKVYLLVEIPSLEQISGYMTLEGALWMQTFHTNVIKNPFLVYHASVS